MNSKFSIVLRLLCPDYKENKMKSNIKQTICKYAKRLRKTREVTTDLNFKLYQENKDIKKSKNFRE